MNTTLTVLLLAVLVSPAYVQHCERRQRIHLDSYQSTKVVFPQQFPVQKGYAGNLTCVWEILTESKFRIMVYPRTWTCSDMTVLNLFYGLSEMAEIDDCVICPSEKGFCPNIIQTRSSDAVLELITYSNDAKGGFDFRFMAINATALVDGCSSVGMIMQADRTPNYIASPNFPEAYPSEKNCLWLIKPVIQDNNTRLVFQFQSQSLEKGVMTKCTDYVTIEGLGEFCETDRDNIFQPSEKMYTENTERKVTFVSDFGFSESGFVLSFYIEDIAKPCLCQHGGTCKNETCLCSMGFKGEYCEKESIEILFMNVSNQIIREENPVWFTAETTDAYKYEIQWFRNGIMVTDVATRYKMTSSATTNGTTINTLSISRAYNRDEGNWTIRASNGVTSIERQLTIKILPRLRLAMLPQYDFSIRSGDILNLKCSVVNPGSLSGLSHGSLVWLKDNQNNWKAAGYQISNTSTTSTLQSSSTTPANSGVYTCYYSSYPDPVRVSIRVNVTEKEQKMCPNDASEGISWSSTIAGTIGKTACSKDQIGTATRLCDSEGKWRNPNLVNCTDKVFHEASQKLTDLREDGMNNTEEVEKTVNDTLQTMKNLTSTTAEMSAGDIQSSLDIIEAVVDVTSLSGATVEKQVFFEVVDNVLSKNNSESWSAVNTETTKDASAILKNMDKLSEQILKKNDTKFNFSGANFELSIDQVNVEEEGIKFPTKNDNSDITENPATFLELPKQTSKTTTEMNYVAVIYKTISDILPTDTNLKRENLNTRMEVKKTVKEYVNSDILSLTTQRDLGELNPPLNLTFYHKNQNQSKELQPVCVSWNFTTKEWSEKGCQKFSTSGKSTSCLCNHLTNFAILMRPYIPETEDESSLKTLSFVGVVISITFIVLTVTIYIVTWKQMKNDQNTMLLNLCVSLVLSYIVFITAVEKTDNEILCSAVTAIIHYLFLVTFFSMLGMGVYYFISITVTYYAMYLANNFKSRSRVHWFLLGAWGIPLVISVSTLAGFWKKGYHLKHYCWLSVESGSLFLFIVPVCCTIVLNLVVIISLIRVLLASSVMMKSSLKKKAASGLRSLGTLLPVLGVTWLFGILAVNKNADFFQYLFIIANSLQGFFIFVSHVVLNKKLMLSLRTQYPSLGALTSFAETSRKDTTVSRSQSTASDTLMKQYKKKGFFSKCRRLNKRKQEGANKLKTFDSFSTERTTDNSRSVLEEKMPLRSDSNI